MSWSRVKRLSRALRKPAGFKGILLAANHYVIPSEEPPSPAARGELRVFVLGVAEQTPIFCYGLGYTVSVTCTGAGGENWGVYRVYKRIVIGKTSQ